MRLSREQSTLQLLLLNKILSTPNNNQVNFLLDDLSQHGLILVRLSIVTDLPANRATPDHVPPKKRANFSSVSSPFKKKSKLDQSSYDRSKADVVIDSGKIQFCPSNKKSINPVWFSQWNGIVNAI